MSVKLGHHSAAMLPYCVNNGKLYFLLEQKDPKFKTPFFDSGLNFLGGNWNPKDPKMTDASPEDTLAREVREEFFLTMEPEESLNALLGQDFLSKDAEKHAKVKATHTLDRLKRVQEAGARLMEGIQYAQSYIMTVNEPISKVGTGPIVYGSSIFVKEMSERGFQGLERLLGELDGKVSTDNLQWGGRTVLASLEDVNATNRKFAWGYDHVVNALLNERALPAQAYGVLRPLTLVSLRGMDLTEVEHNGHKVPTFAGLRKVYSYPIA